MCRTTHLAFCFWLHPAMKCYDLPPPEGFSHRHTKRGEQEPVPFPSLLGEDENFILIHQTEPSLVQSCKYNPKNKLNFIA